MKNVYTGQLLKPLLFFTLFICSKQAISQVYVSPSGTDAPGNGSKASPYKTIGYAINLSTAGKTIYLEPGTYNEVVDVNKSVTIDGQDNTQAILTYTGSPIPSAGVPTLLQISAQNVTVKNIKFIVNLNLLHSAIHSWGDVSGVSILNNHIVAAKTASLTGGRLAYGRRNAISINLDPLDAAYSNNTHGISGVTIQGNRVDGIILPNATVEGFRAAIAVDRADDLVIGGEPADKNVLQAINHEVVSRFFFGGDVLIKNNDFSGGGLELSSSLASTGTVTIESNKFNGLFSIAYSSQLRLQNNLSNKKFIIKANTFSNIKWGISLENFRNTEIIGNEFTPILDDFRLITINTKMLLSNDSSPIDPIGASITSNVFNGLAGSSSGKAIAFYNHKADPGNNYLNGSLIVGLASGRNTFNNNIKWYLYADNSNGVLTKTPNTNSGTGMTGFPEYGSNIYQTTTGYWKKNIRADENLFFVNGSLKAPLSMTYEERLELDTKISDKKDNPDIGNIFYYYPVTNANTGERYYSIQTAIDAASAGDEINTLPGQYQEDVQLNKAGVKLVGPGADLSTIQGVKGAALSTLALSAPGAHVEGFTITRDGNNNTDWNKDPAVDGPNVYGVSLEADNTSVSNLLITLNRNGIYLNNRQNALIENCEITDNRTGILAANNISGAIIRNNNITSNWAQGFLYESSTLGECSSINVVKNNISGNWYSQIEFKAPNTNILNFGANWLGSSSISSTSTPSAEPDYSSQIPNVSGVTGGSASAPGSSFMISGANSAKVDYSIALSSYIDLSPDPGFQPDSSAVWIYNAGVGTPSGKLTDASFVVKDGGTLLIKSTSLNSGGQIGKNLTLDSDAGTSISLPSLQMNGAGKTLTLAKPLTVSAFNAVSGVVKTSTTNLLTITSASGISTPVAGAYIDGPVKVSGGGNIAFPVGKGGIAGVIEVNGVNPDNEITAEYFNSAYSDISNLEAGTLHDVSNKEHWMLSRTGTPTPVTLTLWSFDKAASGIVIPDAVLVAHYENGGWKSYGNAAFSDGVPYKVTSTNISSFSPVTFANIAPQALAVELKSFSATATTAGALLKWTTASESDIKEFRVDKSNDGQTFFPIATIPGKGTATNSYEFIDRTLQDAAYYRLSQIELNGRVKVYSDMIRLVKGLSNVAPLVVYPNPVNTSFFLGNTGFQRNATILLFDVNGRMMREFKLVGLGQAYNIADLQAGIYTIQLKTDEGTKTEKIIKQ